MLSVIILDRLREYCVSSGRIQLTRSTFSYMNAEKHNLDRIYFGGCFIRGAYIHSGKSAAR